MEYASQIPAYATLPMSVVMELMRLDVVSDKSALSHRLFILILDGPQYILQIKSASP